MIRNLFRRRTGRDDGKPVRYVMIASEGRAISDEVIAQAVDMLHAHDGRVTVLTVARLWGTSFGLPNPGLRPSKAEMNVQKQNIASALERLEKAGIEADGHIVTTRHPLKSIRKQVKQRKCEAVIMGADPMRSWFIRGMMWSQEPYRVRARLSVPVHIVCPLVTPKRSPAGRMKRPAIVSAKR